MRFLNTQLENHGGPSGSQILETLDRGLVFKKKIEIRRSNMQAGGSKRHSAINPKDVKECQVMVGESEIVLNMI